MARHDRHLTDSGSIPIDPDVEVEETDGPPARAVHLRWSSIGIVAVGGAVGTAARAALSDAFPARDGLAWAVLVINVVGAYCLGVLLEALAHRGPDVGRRRRLRLLVGTGVLGGFTTYSTLAVDVVQLLVDGRWTPGVGYGLLTVLLGLGAVVGGLWTAVLVRPRDARTRGARTRADGLRPTDDTATTEGDR